MFPRGTCVYDTWFQWRGTGVVELLMKTRVRVRFPLWGQTVTYDRAHATRFLRKGKAP